jgi:hypothetical protein
MTPSFRVSPETTRPTEHAGQFPVLRFFLSHKRKMKQQSRRLPTIAYNNDADGSPLQDAPQSEQLIEQLLAYPSSLHYIYNTTMITSVSRVFYMMPEPSTTAAAGRNSTFHPSSTNAKSPGGEDDDLSLPEQPIEFDTPPMSFQSLASLLPLDDHHCLVPVLSFLSFEDLNSFALASKECYTLRCHKSLDQTRSGSIILGKGVTSTVELMDKIREGGWSKDFRGHRTHLRLLGLNHLTSDIESIDEQFIKGCTPLRHVRSLDCSISPHAADQNGSWLSRYEDYIDKGFSIGLTLSLLVPNLREIDMSYMPLTSLGVAWIAENNPKLEVIRWNRSLIWPINHHAFDILKACQNLKEIHIDEARLLFCQSRRRRRSMPPPQPQDNGSIQDHQQQHPPAAQEDVATAAVLNEYGLDFDALWTSLAENAQKLTSVSCRRARWYSNSKFSPISQDSLMKFVRSASNLKWFRSDLLEENIAILRKERPNIVFC